MTRHALFVLVFLSLALPASSRAQAPAPAPSAAAPAIPLIESADVVGLPREDLSSDLRRDIEALAGAPLDRERLAALAARIDAEHPELAASVRDVTGPDGRVRVVFVLTRIDENEALAANINTRYTVERVDIRGIDEARVSRALLDDLHALVGRPLEDEEADRLAGRLHDEFPEHEVGRSVSRGDETGRVRVTFLVRRSEASWWVPFARNGSKLVYHADQGWSGVFDIPFGSGSNRFSLGLVAGNDDDLVEEYRGYSFRFENREAGTRRLGVSFELARHTQDWTAETLTAIAADPTLPLPYERRLTVTPTITVALTRHLRVTTGLASSQLDALPASGWSAGIAMPPPFDDTRVTATLMGVAFDRTWHPDTGARHGLTAGYDWQSGSSELGSDSVYDRHSGVVRYAVSGRHSGLAAEFRAGYISGDAPLFARFMLGDTHTLRGWNKYAIAPAGAERMVHQSVEFRYKDFLYFVDAGSAWRPGDARTLRLSTGVGLDVKGSFITVGVPLNADAVSGKLMLGIRASVVFDAGWLR